MTCRNCIVVAGSRLVEMRMLTIIINSLREHAMHHNGSRTNCLTLPTSARNWKNPCLRVPFFLRAPLFLLAAGARTTNFILPIEKKAKQCIGKRAPFQRRYQESKKTIQNRWISGTLALKRRERNRERDFVRSLPQSTKPTFLERNRRISNGTRYQGYSHVHPEYPFSVPVGISTAHTQVQHLHDFWQKEGQKRQ